MDDDLKETPDEAAPEAAATTTEAETETPPPPRRRREIHPLRIALIVTLVGSCVVAAIYAPYHRKRAAQLRIQQACLSYEAPGGQVVYEENPPRAAELLSRGGEYFRAPVDGEAIAGHVPNFWRQMCAWAMPGEADAAKLPVLFLHERRTASGMRGLVCVQADRAARRLRMTFISPAGERLDPVAVTSNDVIPIPKEGLIVLGKDEGPLAARLPAVDDHASPRADLRYFAGRADPRDETHILIPYEWENLRGTLDLWVQGERTVVYADSVAAGATTTRASDVR